MLDVRLMHIGQAYGFDEPGNPQKARLNLAGERLERRTYSVIQELNRPGHLIYHFCNSDNISLEFLRNHIGEGYDIRGRAGQEMLKEGPDTDRISRS